MKSEKGITMISMTIYIIVMLLVVTAITSITTYFYKNIDTDSVNSNLNQQYTKFNSFFLEDTNKKGNAVARQEETKDENGNMTQRFILFTSGNQYTYVKSNKAIYINKIKIAENITDCIFEVTKGQKTIVKVTINGEKNFQKTTEYTLVD